ncbi:PAS domain S-box protein, partial [Thermodesulfobacterium thermophilum]|uniref:PAS domain S-box protein n=1 Tax=Thermodesulfobacterium thermophilum TaxID=886 RepID=UPI00052600ED
MVANEKEVHLKDIAEAILEAPSVGVLIYQENIVYANKFFLELTGYSLEELNRMSILDIFPAEEREYLKSVVERRLRGERFTRVYKELKILRKTGEIRYTLTFANTITYQGKPAGFVVLIDITRQKRLENIVLML